MTDSLILADEADRGRWNAFVEASPHGHFFQSWDWGELQRGLGGRPERLAIVSGDGFRGCVQLIVFASDARTFAYVPRGPVVDPGEEPHATVLLEAVKQVSAGGGANLVRIEPQWAFSGELTRRLEDRGFATATQHIMPPRTLLVDLTPPLERIWAAFRSNTRNRIRLAEKRGVKVRVGTEADVATFIRLADDTNTRHGLRLGRPEQFQLAARLFGARDTMRLFLASAEGPDLSGIFVFLWGTTATYLWGASSSAEEARRVNPNQLLHWTAMQWARERGCAAYDFFGIPDYDEDVLEAEYSRQTGGWWNLYRFKRGFGGTVHRHAGTFDCKLEFG